MDFLKHQKKNNNEFILLFIFFIIFNFFFEQPLITECMASDSRIPIWVQYLPPCLYSIAGSPLYNSIVDQFYPDTIYLFTEPILQHLSDVHLGIIPYRDSINEGMLIDEVSDRIYDGMHLLQIYNEIAQLYSEELVMTPVSRRAEVMLYHPRENEIEFYIRELNFGYQQLMIRRI